MHLEAIRMIADWLADADSGVNAMSAILPIDAGDDPPRAVTVADSTRSGWVARGQAPRPITNGARYITIQLNTPSVQPAAEDSRAQPWQEGQVFLLIRHLSSNVDSEAGNAEALYTMRAVRASLALLEQQDNHAARERNKVRLARCTDIQTQSTPDEEDVICFAAMAVTYDVEEVIPTNP